MQQIQQVKFDATEPVTITDPHIIPWTVITGLHRVEQDGEIVRLTFYATTGFDIGQPESHVAFRMAIRRRAWDRILKVIRLSNCSCCPVVTELH